MADRDQLKTLEKGVSAWNAWMRDQDPSIAYQDPPVMIADLSGADLAGADLAGADFHRVNLVGANLCNANLRRAYLFQVNLHGAKLGGATLRQAYMGAADLTSTDVSGADFEEACLRVANFSDANTIAPDYGTSFSRADLSGATLSGVDLRLAKFDYAVLRTAQLEGCDLQNASFASCSLQFANLKRARLGHASFIHTDFTGADLAETQFARAAFSSVVLSNVDLSEAIGLESVHHYGPSSIGIDTLIRSQCKIPKAFLRGVGLSDHVIDYVSALLRVPIEFHSCFISYATSDERFVKQLHADLQTAGVRCWFAPEDLKIGAELRPAFDQEIRVRDKLLLVLSRHSVRSPWVKREVEQALDEEVRRQRDGRQDWAILFPIRLDDTVFEINVGWGSDVTRRYIGDFREWKDVYHYKQAFHRLLADLGTPTIKEHSAGPLPDPPTELK